MTKPRKKSEAPTDCTDWRGGGVLFERALDNMLTKTERGRFLGHLLACAGCRKHWRVRSWLRDELPGNDRLRNRIEKLIRTAMSRT